MGISNIAIHEGNMVDKTIERLQQRIVELESQLSRENDLYEKIRESEARYKMLVEFLPIGIALHDGQKVIYTNKWALKLVGAVSDNQIVGHTLKDFVHPESWPAVASRVRQLIIERKGVGLFQEKFVKIDGTAFDVDVAAIPITYMGRDAVLVSIRDISEEVRFKEALSQQKERLAVTLSSIGDGVIATDGQGIVTLLNDVAQKMTGWTEEDAIGRPLPDVFRIVNEKTRKPVKNPVEKVLKKGVVIGLANGTLLISKDGRESIIADSGAPIKDVDGNIIGVVMVFRDVTQQKHWEKELQRLQRFETLELMAGGIAHDFNNILTGVLGHLSLFMYTLPDNFTGLVHVDEAQKAVLAARQLVGQLSLMSKGGAPVRENASIMDTIESSAKISVTGSNCQLEVNIADDLWNVVCDVDQISQVFQNIAINAVQAMPTGGKITINAVNNIVSDTDGLPLPSGKYIKVSVTDQGTGIPSKYLDRLLDPYFTTKQNGSGLGLAIVYSVVNRHKGHVSIESRQGAGTTVTVWLPASVENKSGKKDNKILWAKHGGRVLVVDDDPIVREVCTKMLQHLGYEAEAAMDSESATEMVKENTENGLPFRFAIMDLTMPGDIGGKQLCKRLLKISPDLITIASSGYPDDPAMVDPEEFGFSYILKKPYTVQEIKRVMAKAGQK